MFVFPMRCRYLPFLHFLSSESFTSIGSTQPVGKRTNIRVDSYHTFVPLKPFTMGSLTELCPCQYPLFPPFKNQLSSKYALYRSAFHKMH